MIYIKNKLIFEKGHVKFINIVKTNQYKKNMLYLMTAKRDITAGVIRKEDQGKINKIPKGYTIQIPSRSTSRPDIQEIKQALSAMGFGSSVILSSNGNWDIKKLS